MSGLVNLIKGLLGFIGGLFGGKKAVAGSPNGKKSKGYFLELDESSPAAAPQSAPVAAAATAQPMTVAADPPATPAAKPSSRKEKLAALAAADQPAAKASASAPVAPAAPKAASVAVANPIAEANFATKYLIPENTGTRRRPGANMSSYLDMARKMNGAS